MRLSVRNALTTAVLLSASALLPSCSTDGSMRTSPEKTGYWKNGIPVQFNMDLSKSEAGTIRARVDGKWQSFTVRELPDGFMEWKREARRKTREAMKAGGGMTIAGSAHHFGAVASHGGHRADTEFSVNNAYKGIGLVPNREKITDAIRKLESTWEASRKEKMEILRELGEDQDSVDRTKLSSLELYTKKDFQTHTFLNIMANPAVSVVFLDIPSYEVRAICRLVHPDDQTASPEEKDILTYVNLLHDYFHGTRRAKSIVMIFHVIQVFDNSPCSKGVRVTP